MLSMKNMFNLQDLKPTTVNGFYGKRNDIARLKLKQYRFKTFAF